MTDAILVVLSGGSYGGAELLSTDWPDGTARTVTPADISIAAPEGAGPERYRREGLVALFEGIP